MSNEELTRMRALPLAKLIQQPSKNLIAFTNHYFAVHRTELHIKPNYNLS